MDLQILINKAQELKHEGKLQAALACYSNAFDLLTKEADGYARNIEGTMVDVGKLRAITSKLFNEVKKYFKKDKTASIISNNMGTILAELGDIEGARRMFVQAIELTPDGVDYSDPKIGIEKLKKL